MIKKNFYWVNLFGYDGDSNMRIYTDNEDKAYAFVHKYRPGYTCEVIKEDSNNLANTFVMNTPDGVRIIDARDFEIYTESLDKNSCKYFIFHSDEEMKRYAKAESCTYKDVDIVFIISNGTESSKLIKIYN